MADIFLSYASEDRGSAKQLFHALRAQGWSVFWDRSIPAGVTWQNAIFEAMDAAKVVVVLWSRASVNSRLVKDEASIARYGDKLVPAVLDDPAVQQFRQVQAQAEQKVAELAKRYGPKHPNMIAAQSELAEATENLQAQQQVVSGGIRAEPALRVPARALAYSARAVARRGALVQRFCRFQRYRRTRARSRRGHRRLLAQTGRY